MMRGYFDPEEQKRRNKAQQGLNLVRAGLAVGTSATPEQLSKNLDPVISSAAKSIDARDKEGLMQAKFEADIAKQNRERDTNIAELAYKSQYTQAMVDQAGGKDQANIAIAKQLAKADPKTYGTAVRDKNDPKKITYTTEPNTAALFESGRIIGTPQITSQMYGSQRDINEKADKWVRSSGGSKYRRDLSEDGVPEDQQEKQAKDFYLKELAEGRDLLLLPMYQGGKIPSLGEDPPMLDMSSRF